MVRGTCGAFRGAGRAGLSTWRAGRVGKVYMEEGLFREFYVESGASCKGRGVHRRPPPRPAHYCFSQPPKKVGGFQNKGSTWATLWACLSGRELHRLAGWLRCYLTFELALWTD